MKRVLKNIIRLILKKYDLVTIDQGTLQRLFKESFTLQLAQNNIELILHVPNDKLPQLLPFLFKSNSQLWQELFVIFELGFKRNGYFVEFGATNGVDLSNTYLLEKEFGWNGILAEPAKCWHEDLRKNRNVNIDTNCVWRDSDSILTFNQTQLAELSTINSFSFADNHRKAREIGQSYDVKTISLVDILAKYNAPKQIDFLSIDTEGSEYEILSNFDFDKYQFRIITCEHNFTPMREQIFSLLSRNGYVRKFEELSKCDDWYIKVN